MSFGKRTSVSNSSEEHKDIITTTVQPTMDSPSDRASLAHVPASNRSKLARFRSYITSKDAWLGQYNYGALLIPDLPFMKRRKRFLPFYYHNDILPIILAMLLGLQHALAMVGGIITPPLLLGGSSGANLSAQDRQYLLSSSLIFCAIGTCLQVSRIRIWRDWYIGTGIISVLGTSFAFVNVGLGFMNSAYSNGLCSLAADGTKLPCPEAFGAFLGTASLCGLFSLFLALLIAYKPSLIKTIFPTVVIGVVLTLIGIALVKSGFQNWIGGSAPCSTNHAINCTFGSQTHKWGSAPLIGLGFLVFAVIIFCEIFGSPIMRNISVFLGLLVGMIVAGALGYFNQSVIDSAPNGQFLWLHTYKLSLDGSLVLPMLAAYWVIVAEAVANITASCDVSRIDVTSEECRSRIQGGMLSDAITAIIAPLATVPPLTTFSQNIGVIVLTKNSSRMSGYFCAFFLFLMGVIGKFTALFAAMPASVLGGMTTFLFASVCAAGLRILAYLEWTRRDRFIVTGALAVGLGAALIPNWFSYFFTYSGNDSALSGFLDAIELVMSESYLIGALIAIVLNLSLREEEDDDEEDSSAHPKSHQLDDYEPHESAKGVAQSA